MNASRDITEEELLRTRSDEEVKLKLSESPLGQFLFGLVSILETDSQESQSLEKAKNTISPVKASPTLPSPDHGNDNPLPDLPSTPSPRQHVKQSDEPVNHKRKISDVSFLTSSTETTPSKLSQREALVQSLQNAFVEEIVKILWLGQIDIDWAKDRKMFLTYGPYSPFFSSLLTIDNRKSPFNIASGTIPTQKSLGE